MIVANHADAAAQANNFKRLPPDPLPDYTDNKGNVQKDEDGNPIRQEGLTKYVFAPTVGEWTGKPFQNADGSWTCLRMQSISVRVVFFPGSSWVATERVRSHEVGHLHCAVIVAESMPKTIYASGSGATANAALSAANVDAFRARAEWGKLLGQTDDRIDKWYERLTGNGAGPGQATFDADIAKDVAKASGGGK